MILIVGIIIRNRSRYQMHYPCEHASSASPTHPMSTEREFSIDWKQNEKVFKLVATVTKVTAAAAERGRWTACPSERLLRSITRGTVNGRGGEWSWVWSRIGSSSTGALNRRIGGLKAQQAVKKVHTYQSLASSRLLIVSQSISSLCHLLSALSLRIPIPITSAVLSKTWT